MHDLDQTRLRILPSGAANKSLCNAPTRDRSLRGIEGGQWVTRPKGKKTVVVTLYSICHTHTVTTESS